MPNAVPVDEAAGDFPALVDRVIARGEPVTLTREGKPVAELRPIRRVRLKDLPDLFARLPRPGPDEADAFARDVEEARNSAERVLVHDPRGDTA